MTAKAPHDDQSNMPVNTESLQEQEKLLELKAGEVEQTNNKQQQQEEGQQQKITTAALQESMHHRRTSSTMADAHSKGANTTGTLADQTG